MEGLTSPRGGRVTQDLSGLTFHPWATVLGSGLVT